VEAVAIILVGAESKRRNREAGLIATYSTRDLACSHEHEHDENEKLPTRLRAAAGHEHRESGREQTRGKIVHDTREEGEAASVACLRHTGPNLSLSCS
jgi:hypothetical protein